MPQLIIDGLATSYTDQGTGPVVLMIHGWGSSGAAYDVLAAAVAKHHRVVRLDLPGFGGSQLPPTTWGIPEYSLHTVVFCHKLGISPQAVIGHSMGGQMALYLVGQGLLRPQRLVLFGASGVRDAHTLRQRLTVLLAKTGKLATRPFPRLAHRLRTSLYQANGNTEYLEATPQLAANYRRVITEDQRANAANTHIPTLLIWGEDDADTPLRNAHILQRIIPGSTLEVLPGAGHFVFLDKPADSERLVLEFIQ